MRSVMSRCGYTCGRRIKLAGLIAALSFCLVVLPKSGAATPDGPRYPTVTSPQALPNLAIDPYGRVIDVTLPQELTVTSPWDRFRFDINMVRPLARDAGAFLGDLTGDGLPDMLMPSFTGETLFFPGVGGGPTRFGAGSYLRHTQSSPAENPFDFGAADWLQGDVGDLDGDGIKDVVIGNVLYRNVGTGSEPVLESAYTFTGGGFFDPSASIGDLNADGKPDVVITWNYVSGNAHIYWNNSTPGNFSFTRQALNNPNHSSSEHLALGDINGDGLLDLVCPDGVYLNSGTPEVPSFNFVLSAWNKTGGPSWLASSDQPPHVVLRDGDGDGLLDAYVSNLSTTLWQVLFYRNVGTAAAHSLAYVGPVVCDASPTDAYYHGETSPSWSGSRALVATGDIDNNSSADVLLTPSQTFIFSHPTILWNYPTEGGPQGHTLGYQDLYTYPSLDRISPSCGADSFTSPDAACGPPHVFAGWKDVTGDGAADALRLDQGNNFSLYKRVRTGTLPFTLGPEIAVTTQGGTQAAALGLAWVDVDLDNQVDVIGGDEDGHLRWYRNLATDGSFVPADPVLLTDASGTPIDVGSQSWPTAIDLDGDSDLDLLVSNYDGNVFKVFCVTPGSPQGFALGPQLGTPQQDPLDLSDIGGGGLIAPTLTTIDVNGDGKADVVIGDVSGRVWLLRNVGTAGIASFVLEPLVISRTQAAYLEVVDPHTVRLRFALPTAIGSTRIAFHNVPTTEGPVSGEVTILPSLSINDVTVAEGQSGTTTASFTVNLSPPINQTVSVNWSTSDGSATAGSDYLPASGTLTFDPGEISKSISITVLGDSLYEADETFTLNLTAAINAAIIDGQGLATILNDDVPPPPTLGNYPDTTVQAGANTTITPDAAPTTTTNMNASTTSAFRGAFGANPTTGAVQVTDAQPAGTYIVTVTAFNSAGVTTTKTFTLTVNNPAQCLNTTFSTGSPFGVGSYPYSVAVGDFNGDGKQDLAATNYGSNNVTVLLGNGSGGFSAASGSPFAVDTHPISVAVGDFNGDGRQDLAVANSGSNNVTVLLGNGSGGFTPATGSPLAVGTNPFSVAVGDFNGDGKLDLTTANRVSNNVTVLLGDGSGGFSPASGSPITVGTDPRSVAVGDFDRDGKLDLTIANFNSNNVTVLLGNGSGGFSASTGSPFGVGTDPYSVAVGDLNGDGKLDLVTANVDFNNVTVLLGNGSGGFSPATGSPFTVGTNPFSVAVGDFNGDGRQDLAAANYNSNNVTVLLGDGSGGFSAASGSPFAVGSHPLSVVVGDFNADGKMDLATANVSSDDVTVLLNTCTANTAPTISAVGVTRQQGSPSANATIANVNDLEDPETALTVTVNGGASATVNGVTASGISVDVAGVVTADVVASCTATTATFTLRVTDTGGPFNEATLTVTVNPNTAPTLTYSSPQAVLFGGSLTLSPTTTGDNGAVTYSVQPGHGLITAPTVDASGVVSITNAQPPGAHTVTIRATDNCGPFTDAAFTLNVGEMPTFTIDDVTHNEGNTGSTSYTFTVTKTGSTALNSSVNFTTLDGTATTANNDYQANSGTLNFLSTDTTKQITVLVNGDTTVEPDEVFTVHLSGASNATISDADGAGTITNDDCSVSLSNNAEFSAAGGAGSVNVTTASGCAWAATSNASWITITSGGTSTGNGTVNYSVDSNLSDDSRTGTITIAGQTFTVNQSGIPAGLSYYKTDFDSDGKTDLGFYRAGLWGFLKSSQSFSTGSPQFFSWGGTGLYPICADVDGDGKADIAYMVLPSGGQSATYAILLSSRGYSFAPGQPLFVPAGFPSLGDTPVVGDFDGDGKADPGIWRASQGVWIIPSSSSGYTSFVFAQWGQLGDIPVIADFDQDGKADIGFYRDGLWGMLQSSHSYSTGSPLFFSWGGAGLQPIVGDFDGDGKADIGYMVPPTAGQSATYAILLSSRGYSFAPGQPLFVPAGFPSLGDTPVVGDFDGDGKADPGIWRESQGVWILPLSSSNYTSYIFSQWGQSGDIAFPNSSGKR